MPPASGADRFQPLLVLEPRFQLLPLPLAALPRDGVREYLACGPQKGDVVLCPMLLRGSRRENEEADALPGVPHADGEPRADAAPCRSEPRWSRRATRRCAGLADDVLTSPPAACGTSPSLPANPQDCMPIRMRRCGASENDALGGGPAPRPAIRIWARSTPACWATVRAPPRCLGRCVRAASR